MKQIPLTQGYVAIVDNEDYEELSKHKWCVLRTKNGLYAARSTRKKEGNSGAMVYMHRQILGALPSENVDHTNHDGLNNQRMNIRICTTVQNCANRRKRRGCSSTFKGVCWKKNCAIWYAQIYRDGKQYHLGTFVDECDAARAYNVAALDYFGEFALLNDV